MRVGLVELLSLLLLLLLLLQWRIQGAEAHDRDGEMHPISAVLFLYYYHNSTSIDNSMFMSIGIRQFV